MCKCRYNERTNESCYSSRPHAVDLESTRDHREAKQRARYLIIYNCALHPAPLVFIRRGQNSDFPEFCLKRL